LSEVIDSLWQFCGGLSECVGNPRTNFLKDIFNFCKKHLFVRGLLILPDVLSEVIDYPLGHVARGLLIYKQRGNLAAVPLKQQKVKLKLKKQLFEVHLLCLLFLFIPSLADLNLVRQSL
jgi:hypothetical protein